MQLSAALNDAILERVKSDALECITEKDIGSFYRLADKIALIPTADREEITYKAKQVFGSDFDKRSWNQELKIHSIDSKRIVKEPAYPGMLVDSRGQPKGLLANAIIALRSWGGVLGFNELALRVEARQPPPWPGAIPGIWGDNEDRLTAAWLQHEGIIVPVLTAAQAVETVAQESPFHPVREYLSSLKWDGTGRIGGWLSLYLGVEPNDYVSAVGERWLISGVARIMQPGSKVDCCLILEGPQGLRKSTALKTIAGSWFSDEIADLGSKDAAMQTSGVWIIELAELDSLSRGEVGKIKAFMSRAVDRFRPPFGRRVLAAPRQCIFAGSVNHGAYLRDETGGRRFWPVVCTRILIDDLARDRDQLWAEAFHKYNAGAKWWLDTDELNETAAAEQADRYEGDAWDELIEAWVEDPTQRCDAEGHPIEPFGSSLDSVSIVDVLLHAISKRPDTWTQVDKNRIARSLQSLGFERYRHGPRSNREWRYKRVSRSGGVTMSSISTGPP